MKTIFTFMLMLIATIGLAQDKIYVHTATAANTSGHITDIDHPDLNGNPNAGLVYVNTWNPNGLPSVYNNNVSGLWYDGSKWTIYNETLSPIVIGAHFMVYIADDPNSVITHTSNAGNQGTFGAFTTVIDNPSLNGANPGPFAIVSHLYTGEYNTQNFGLYYDVALGKRGIYDENGGPAIPSGASFKVLVQGQGVTRFSHTANAANITSHTTRIDHPSLNGNPNATFVFSHYWGATGASSEVDLDALTSIYYASGFWRIYCEDGTTPMPEGIVFDIIVAPQDTLGVNETPPTTAITMFPNPAINNVNFKASETIENITIFNVLGQQIMSLDENANDVQMDVSSLATGAYLAKVKTAEGSQTLKLIKE